MKAKEKHNFESKIENQSETIKALKQKCNTLQNDNKKLEKKIKSHEKKMEKSKDNIEEDHEKQTLNEKLLSECKEVTTEANDKLHDLQIDVSKKSSIFDPSISSGRIHKNTPDLSPRVAVAYFSRRIYQQLQYH